jgi:phenylpropionate dioxygenase-like ring-hydroxylating dioxygenase large terminal subunit
MATRAPFLKARYSGYHHRRVPSEDAELTHVGPDTACGEYMRRFWQPVCYSDDLRDLPLRVKILGEELVAFRDRGGAAGLLELHCPHRGTSLEFGLVGDKGIRCCYHGWLFDVDGTILETPGEPPTSRLKDRLFHGAYPIHEAHGILFAYLGPPEQKPDFPTSDSVVRPGFRVMPGQKYFYPCNWLQILENTMDAVHTAFLHTIVSGAVFTDEFGVLPELDFAETPVGIIYIATRRVGDNIWSRSVENVLPNLQQVAPIWETGHNEHPFSGPMMSRWIVPLDNTNTMLIELRHVSETEGVITPDWWADRSIMLPGQLGMDTYEGKPAASWRFRSPGLAAPGRRPWSRTSRYHRSGHHDVPQPDPPRHPGGQGRPRSPVHLSRRRRRDPDLLQRHGGSCPAGADAGARQAADACDRATARRELSQTAATARRRRVSLSKAWADTTE